MPLPADRPAAGWEVVASGLAFPEAMRWHQGRLWFSDIFGRQVLSVAPGGEPVLVVDVPQLPSGLGWRPDGTLLVVAMRSRQLLAIGGSGATVVADLGELVAGDCNDMVVDDGGRAYIGNFGYDYRGGEERKPTSLCLVQADGTVTAEGADLWFPNGMVITPDGRTLLVAETSAARISAFDIGPDGSLSGQRIFAEVEGTRPDGMCLDADGALWVASPGPPGEILHIGPGGDVLHRWPAPGDAAQCCMLGGGDGRTLFVCSSPTPHEEEAVERREARILATTVEVPRAGRP